MSSGFGEKTTLMLPRQISGNATKPTAEAQNIWEDKMLDAGSVQPPKGSRFAFRIFVILLAAGRSSRTSSVGASKLLAEFEGVALVRRSAQVALGSSAHAVIVVTGHRRFEIEAALDGLGVECIENTKYDHGMATSLTTGISYCDARGANAVLVLLADMPGLTTAHLDRLFAAFRSTDGEVVVRAMGDGKPGNPVILPKSLFETIARLEGDVGARQICPSSNDLRLFLLLKIGVSGSVWGLI